MVLSTCSKHSNTIEYAYCTDTLRYLLLFPTIANYTYIIVIINTAYYYILYLYISN